MNASLKLLQEEVQKLERMVKTKTNLLLLPINILSDREIKDLRKIVLDFSSRLDRLTLVFEEEKESKTTNKPQEIDEEKIELLFSELRGKEKVINENLSYLMSEFERAKKEDEEALKTTFRVASTSYHEEDHVSRSEGSSDSGEQDKLIINKIFLNSIMTTNHVNILQGKETLEEEKQYITDIFKLKELFPSAESKELILLDFFMNIYSFCLREKYTVEKISTVMSIFYFLFSYSFINNNVVMETSLTLYQDIIDYHSYNRLPYSHKVFSVEDRENLIQFGKNSFFRNYSLFENIFRYEVSICFFSKDFKAIPLKPFPKGDGYLLKDDIITSEIPEFVQKIMEEKEITQEDQEDHKDDDLTKVVKTQEEINEEIQLEKLKSFVNSFYKATNRLDQTRQNEETLKLQKKMEVEALEAKGFLTTKIPELEKEIDEKVLLVTKNVMAPINEALAEKAEKTVKKKA